MTKTFNAGSLIALGQLLDGILPIKRIFWLKS